MNVNIEQNRSVGGGAGTALRRAPAPRGRDWHKLLLGLGAAAAIALTIWLTVYGSSYYVLDATQRPLSPKHDLLKPGGRIGISLGIFGGMLFLLIFLYALRKRWHWLSRRGKTKNWLDIHVLMGLTAPVVITFHSSFKLQGVAGLAYWVMMSVVASGIVGRYFYAQIPRRLDEAEMSLEELQVLCDRLTADLTYQTHLSAADLLPLLRLPRAEEVRSISLLRALWLMVRLDLERPFRIWSLRRRIGGSHRSPEFHAAMVTVRRQAALSKKVLLLSKTRQMFHLWHIIHRPFSYSFAILASLHVIIVLLLGFF